MSERKLAFILGCGDTGMFMPEAPGAYVIGVNDAGKFGKHIDALFFINRPRHFNEPALYKEGSRLDVIKNTPVSKVISLDTIAKEWGLLFPDKVTTITVQRWAKTSHRDQVYHTDNSPFSAMSYAVTQGYTDIVLYGVDFNNHRYLKAVTSAPAFSQYAFAVSKLGVTIYKGHTDQNLNLPIWYEK